MIALQSYIVMLLIQATAISILAIAMSQLARVNAATRHTIALTGLVLILLCPLATWLLPLRWNALISTTHESRQSVAVVASDVLQPTSKLTSSPGDSDVGNRLQPANVPIEWDDQRSVAALDIAATPSATVAPAHEPVRDVSREVKETKAESSVVNAKNVLVVFLCVWFTGMFFVAVRLLVRRRRFRFMIQPRRQLPTEFFSESTQQCLRRSLNMVELPTICTSPTVPSPVVWGVLRPQIVLPEAIANEVSEQELTNVLIHECAHIARKDHWVHLGQQIAAVLWWFHPGVRVVIAVLARAREEVCDNYVLRQSKPVDFARTLLKLTERGKSVRPALSLLGLFGRQWNLETRVKELLDPKRVVHVKTERRWTVAIVSALSACCLAVGGASAMHADEGSAVAALATNADIVQKQSSESTPSAQATAVPTSGESVQVSVSGKCYLTGTDDPVVANVRMYRTSSRILLDGPDLLGEIRANAKGEFKFRDLVVSMDSEYQSIVVIATAPGFSSAYAAKFIAEGKSMDDLKLELSNNIASLSGAVTDESGAPIEGATVFLPNGTGHPVSGFRSAVTDSLGRYEISDLQAWKQKKEDLDKFGFWEMSIQVQHPDFPISFARYSALPQVVDIKLPPPAVIEGRVMDLVSGTPVANVLVHAQGIVHSGWAEVLTDKDGHFRLRLARDHYNIWAVQKDRMPLAIKALEAIPGVRSRGHEIRMVRGGFIKGRVVTNDGEPVSIPYERNADPLVGQSKTNGSSAKNLFANMVGHHGPARPATGAAVTSAKVDADGKFRLHVAPGRNYLYFMPDQSANAYVNVGDGQEVELDLVIDQGSRQRLEANPDRMLRNALLQKRWQEGSSRQQDEKQNRSSSGSARQFDTTRIRRDSPTNRLLDKLEDMNRNNELRLSEPWAELMHEIALVGPDAVPELIEELDATNHEGMLRCLGFVLRAIGDRRAVPGLIRAIPKTLQPGSSDYGLRIENNKDLLAFLQKYDLGEQNQEQQYDFGRPVREIFGALKSLTGQQFEEQELFHIHREGFPSQIRLMEELFHQHASQWSDWWEESGSAMVEEAEYKKVRLAPLPGSEPAMPTFDIALKTGSGVRGAVLTSIRTPRAATNFGNFYDLDTGRYASLPERWNRKSLSADDVDAILRWASEKGFDIMCDEYRDKEGNQVFALRTIGLEAWQLDESRWKKMPDELTVDRLKSEGDAVTGDWLLFQDPKTKAVDPQKHAPFLFVTSEGIPGVIYVGVPTEVNRTPPSDSGPTAIVLPRTDLELISSHHFRSGRRFGIEALLPK